MDNILLLKTLIEESQVSHEKCAELVTMISQMDFYVQFKANTGDLYAQNIVEQVNVKTVV